jgi:hypothetical protein
MMGPISLAMITGAALIAAAETANAQGTGTGSGPSGTAFNLCWDVSTSMVRDKNRTDTGSTETSSMTSSKDDATTPNTKSTVGSTSTKDAMGTGIARPAGIPDCPKE